QAISNVAAELMPQPGKYSTRSRDYEYKRLGTVSLLVGIDLHDGKAIGIVRDRHRSKEFVEYLELVDKMNNDDWKIRIILDNHAHLTERDKPPDSGYK
ncbi:MAG: transposase, partial [Candidatus Anammoxibacter sp.]